jgi:spectinomycin phosphotransferase
VKARPEGLETSDVLAAVAAGWGLAVDRGRYVPVGAGSHHWTVGGGGARAFVTVDDLCQKQWLGSTVGETLAGLRSAFETAVRLVEAGLEFVVAPRRAIDGAVLRPLDDRYSVAVFPFVDGTTGRFDVRDRSERADVGAMLAELHRATPAVEGYARPVGLELPGRDSIESALAEADVPWHGGPLAEAARRVFVRGVGEVAGRLALADRLAAVVGARGAPWVVTHGEPHPVNVIETARGRVLVDWDTVALAPPERDLWLVTASAADETSCAYVDTTGRAVDQDALDFYRLIWDLKDLAEYLHVLRAPHTENEDTARALRGIESCISPHPFWAVRIEELSR